MVKNSATSYGTLYVVATPIGNRQDISFRAKDILNSVHAILAEDTRHSRPLLKDLGIQKPLVAFHAHNEKEASQSILETLKQGQSLALISDAGTPLISDPGFPLIRLAREKNIPVVPIPGACALITALSAAGVPCDSFTFVGFLPAKEGARRKKLQALQYSEHTVVLYESPYRLMDCIEDILDIYGPTYEWVLAKELTKTFEHFSRGTSLEIKAWLQADSSRGKGEFVLILPAKPQETETSREKEVLAILLQELPFKQAIRLTSLVTKVSKNKLYKLGLHLSE